MRTMLSDSTLARVLRASKIYAEVRAKQLTEEGDGETVYTPHQDSLGAWHVRVVAVDGTVIYDEVVA